MGSWGNLPTKERKSHYFSQRKLGFSFSRNSTPILADRHAIKKEENREQEYSPDFPVPQLSSFSQLHKIFERERDTILTTYANNDNKIPENIIINADLQEERLEEGKRERSEEGKENREVEANAKRDFYMIDIEEIDDIHLTQNQKNYQKFATILKKAEENMPKYEQQATNILPFLRFHRKITANLLNEAFIYLIQSDCLYNFLLILQYQSKIASIEEIRIILGHQAYESLQNLVLDLCNAKLRLFRSVEFLRAEIDFLNSKKFRDFDSFSDIYMDSILSRCLELENCSEMTGLFDVHFESIYRSTVDLFNSITIQFLKLTENYSPLNFDYSNHIITHYYLSSIPSQSFSYASHVPSPNSCRSSPSSNFFGDPLLAYWLNKKNFYQYFQVLANKNINLQRISKMNSINFAEIGLNAEDSLALCTAVNSIKYFGKDIVVREGLLYKLVGDILKNYKKRYYILTANFELKYFASPVSKKLLGQIPLKQVIAVTRIPIDDVSEKKCSAVQIHRKTKISTLCGKEQATEVWYKLLCSSLEYLSNQK